MSPPANCQSCGVCCFSQLTTYVPVTGADWSRLAAQAEQVAHFIGHRVYLKMGEGHCAALAIGTAADGSPAFVCTIYAQRPQICRDLERGSPVCRGELAAKADRVTAALTGAPPMA